jgi:hypothetical protein
MPILAEDPNLAILPDFEADEESKENSHFPFSSDSPDVLNLQSKDRAC